MLESLGIEPAVLAIQAGLFLVLFFFMKRLLFDRALREIEGREREVRSALEKIDRGKAETERLLAEYQAKIAGIEKEAYARMQEAIRQGQAERARLLEEAHAQARALLERSRAEIRGERELAAAALRREIDALARQAAEKLLD